MGKYQQTQKGRFTALFALYHKKDNFLIIDFTVIFLLCDIYVTLFNY